MGSTGPNPQSDEIDEFRWRPLAVATLVALIAAALSVALLPTAGFGREPRIRALRAKADAFVSAASRRTNFGHSRSLRVAASPPIRTYLRFRFVNHGNPVAHVSLLLWSRHRSRAGYHVSLADGRWNERKITYVNAPVPSSRFVASGPVGAGAWTAVNVTPLLDGEERAVSFAVTTASHTGAEFASREAGLHGPRLVVETAPPTTTATTTTGDGQQSPPSSISP